LFSLPRSQPSDTLPTSCSSASYTPHNTLQRSPQRSLLSFSLAETLPRAQQRRRATETKKKTKRKLRVCWEIIVAEDEEEVERELIDYCSRRRLLLAVGIWIHQTLDLGDGGEGGSGEKKEGGGRDGFFLVRMHVAEHCVHR
jgi:hypothetical protein